MQFSAIVPPIAPVVSDVSTPNSTPIIASSLKSETLVPPSLKEILPSSDSTHSAVIQDRQHETLSSQRHLESAILENWNGLLTSISQVKEASEESCPVLTNPDNFQKQITSCSQFCSIARSHPEWKADLLQFLTDHSDFFKQIVPTDYCLHQMVALFPDHEDQLLTCYLSKY